MFAALAIVMIFCGYGLTKINTSIKLTKLFSPDAEIIHNYEWLETKLGPLIPMEVVVRIDNSRCQMSMLERMQLISRVQDRLQGIPDVGSTMSAVTFAVPLEIKRAGPFVNKRMMASILNLKLVEHRDEYLESGFLSDDGDYEMWRISARVGALNDIDYGEFIKAIKAEVDPVIHAQRAELAKTSGKDPRPAATERGGAAAAPGVVAAIAGSAPSTDAPLPAAASDAAVDTQGITAIYTGLVPVVYKAQRAMLDGLAWNFVTDLMTIAAVMTVVFWDVSAGLILLVPSIFPVVVVFGLMGWMGIMIDVGTIMTPTVALGVSVDDVVHFLIQYRRGLAEGRDRRGAIMLAYESCARAMYQSWSVLGLGLAVFALSSFVPTQRFGAMMFCLLTAALVGNLLMLPAVLASPIAFFFGRRLVKRARRQRKAQTTETSPAVHAADHVASPPHLSPGMRRDPAHRSVSS